MADQTVTTCFWPWSHQWGKWIQRYYPLVKNGKKTEAQIGFNERICERCGKMQKEML